MVLCLFGHFEYQYLAAERSEGLDWVWDHRLEDLRSYLSCRSIGHAVWGSVGWRARCAGSRGGRLVRFAPYVPRVTSYQRVTIRRGEQPGDRDIVTAMTDDRAQRWTGGLADQFGPGGPAIHGQQWTFIVYRGSEPVGAVVAERSLGAGVVLAVLTAPKARRQGVAFEALTLVMEDDEFEGSAFTCEISARNRSSRRVFERLGFTEAGKDKDGYISYQYAPDGAELPFGWEW